MCPRPDDFWLDDISPLDIVLENHDDEEEDGPEWDADRAYEFGDFEIEETEDDGGE